VKRQKRYPIGFFHVDIAEVQTAEGKLYLFVGIDRTSKFAVTQLVEKADRRTAWEFLQHMLEAVPYHVHTILTDNGIQFAEQPRNRNTIISRPMRFDMICEANGIEHRLTKPNHPWTNGQVERMNRTIKDATVKRFHYDSHDQLRTHLADFMAAYNFARTAQDARRPHALRIHLQDLDLRARSIHPRSDPPDAGTEHLVFARPARPARH
jgi:IS30 family transposase